MFKCMVVACFPAGCRELLIGFWFPSRTKAWSWDCAFNPKSTLETCTKSWGSHTQHESRWSLEHRGCHGSLFSPGVALPAPAASTEPPELQAVPDHSPIPQTPGTLRLSWLTQGSYGHHNLPNPHSWKLKCLLPEQIPRWDHVLPDNSCCHPLSLILSFRSLIPSTDIAKMVFHN